MKAVVITSPGDADVLQIQERPAPEPGPDQILVRVMGSALNRADLLQRRGLYPAPPGAPKDIPGLEYAGEVVKTGERVSLWNQGDRVMGIIGGGGHAEFACVHQREAIRIPDSFSWEEAAAIPEAFLTAWDALDARMRLQAGETLLIHAVGSGVGTAAVQIGRAIGATTLGTSRSADKLTRAVALGLDHGVPGGADVEWAEQVLQITRGRGVDAILELVGGDYVPASIDCVAEQGRIALVGLVGGRGARIDLAKLLGKRAELIGTVLRSRPLEQKIALARDFAARAIPLFESGQLQPVIDSVYPFGDAGSAHRHLESNETFGKIVLTW